MTRTAATAALLIALAAAAHADPRRDYMLQCRGCHGPDGAGVDGAAPPLRDLGRFLAAPGGRDYLVRVPGTARSELDDAAIAALLNWLLTEQHAAPAGFQPYTAAEVAALRARPLIDPAAERRALLADVAP